MSIWLKHYGSIPKSLNYPQISLYEAIQSSCLTHKDSVAFSYFGRVITYKQLLYYIDKFAFYLKGVGIDKNNRISIILPTCPQAVIAFYAINKIGAIASFIHPLSSEDEITNYINISNSTFAITLDIFANKVLPINNKTPLKTIMQTNISTFMPFFLKIAYNVFKKSKKIANTNTTFESAIKQKNLNIDIKPKQEYSDTAVILYSGGTTGKPKGIELSNYNLIANAIQVSTWANLSKSDKILAILPIFHGFGLSVCINAVLMGGAQAILVPNFDLNNVIKLIKKEKPTFLVGVPTLYKALLDNKDFRKINFSFLNGAFSGADMLPEHIKKDFDALVEKSGSSAKLREGYGLTESVTAIAAIPLDKYKSNSIGIPFPDMQMKIIDPASLENLKPNEIGEICVSGPCVMKGYLNNELETKNVLKTHNDGKIWLHTGDLGYMDEDGFFYFKQRLKRMIKVSGMNVYPTEIESVLTLHENVKFSCAIGVKDPYKMHRIKAFIELKHQINDTESLKKELIALCKKHLNVWSVPYDIEFTQLPRTKIGKIDCKLLEEKENEKNNGKN
ncbi:Long-chain-fatty-acid--CoA ligase [Desulfurella amilsii]|uniref:Long-chain-fatty-acid--CoA ligase n=1 Tax=Desulfurella amilsii TaxID=1562698 RepID=A0A1X4XUF5_9BACT|nr:AMP-binding protein [Desulfurella amilsii]OSS41166.1 Long-chain-fatty-acid--CoA ligase [Desulfurella amilsii]